VKNFIRKEEDFVCERCGEKVMGDGYTDHCPKCLFGKHVDKEIPGDRESKCGGVMEPIKAIYEKEKFKIMYRCIQCGHEFWVKEGVGDDREKLVELAK